MIRPLRQSAGLLALLLVTSAALIAAETVTSYLPNGSFEREMKGRPQGWRTEKWGGQGKQEYAATGRTGKRSLMLSSEQGGDIGWTATASVEPYARYRLSGWIKTENVQVKNARGALLNLHNIQPVATKALTGTQDWTKVEVEFDTEDQDSVQVNCLLGGWGLATGTAWYDDLALEQISKSKPQNPSIAIDASKRGAPVSKYVYGQFIEHLGRCIYGGIWAEMLEDRKFYDPVGSKESPWQALDGTKVQMDRERPFVGEHTPKITSADCDIEAGISQSGLGLRKGQSYVGRIWLATPASYGPIHVELVWGPGEKDRQEISLENAPGEFTKHSLKFQAGADTDDGRLEIRGRGTYRIGTVSLMPADNVRGMRPDTLALLKELDSPVYRWPGGNFVSGYNWKDGIGDPDRRPPRKNPAWKGIEHNDFGMDEFMVFCRELKTDPYIAVNSGLGGVESAVEELQYANGKADSPMGKLRAKNGHAEPYAVKFWGVGNEMYGNWQLGHMPLSDYIKKHNVFAKALREADPSIKLVGVGDSGPWSEGMLRECADNMDYLSEHFYCQERPGLSAHVRQIPDAVKRKAENHRRYHKELGSLKGKFIPIALDEWNYWYGPHVFGELGTRYFLKDGLGIAAGLHEMARQSDVFFMANYAQTVNVIGCIKTNKTDAAFETTGLVLKLYRKEFGTVPVATESSRFIDAQAALSADGKSLTVGVVNPSTSPLDVALDLKGVKLTGRGKRWQMAGEDPQAYNDPSKPLAVKFDEASVEGVSNKLSVGPCSVTLFKLDVE